MLPWLTASPAACPSAIAAVTTHARGNALSNSPVRRPRRTIAARRSATGRWRAASSAGAAVAVISGRKGYHVDHEDRRRLAEALTTGVIQAPGAPPDLIRAGAR